MCVIIKLENFGLTCSQILALYCLNALYLFAFDVRHRTVETRRALGKANLAVFI